jgi:2-amino-4-hydroxy-6-hydroxymethyldihydropteridine diphosphokinase
LYETKALTLDGVPQPNYLNAVLSVSTTLEPQEILQQLLAVEQLLGRDRSPQKRWEPRSIDLDLLFVGELVESSAALTLPHPEIPHRDFVLQPLEEIAPDYVHPIVKRSIASLLEDLLQQGRERFVIRKIVASPS